MKVFEIKLRNRKKDTPVEFRVVEHLYRWSNWEIRAKSNDFVKKIHRRLNSAFRSSPTRNAP